MARPLRLEYEGAFYHVTSRGNERGKIFFSEADYLKFLDYLREAIKKYGIILHGYVLMTNHYHLLIETPEANLSKVMHYLNGSYTTYINIKKSRSGHLFQGRYKAIVVDRDSYLGELSRYIHLNPVRVNIVKQPEEYIHSSYRAYISGKGQDLVNTSFVLDLTGGVKAYRAFVEAGVGSDMENPLAGIYGGMIKGKTEFIKESLKKLKDSYEGKAEISHRRALRTADSADDIIAIVAQSKQVTEHDLKQGLHPEAKKIAIYLLKKYTGMTNNEIGRKLGGLTYSAIAKAFSRLEEKMKKDRRLRSAIRKIEGQMSNVKG